MEWIAIKYMLNFRAMQYAIWKYKEQEIKRKYGEAIGERLWQHGAAINPGTVIVYNTCVSSVHCAFAIIRSRQ